MRVALLLAVAATTLSGCQSTQYRSASDTPATCPPGTRAGLCAATPASTDADQTGLTSAEIAAIHEALDDERRAAAFYAAVLETYPDLMPFSRIIHSELRHQQMLIALLESHGLPVPADERAPEQFDVPATTVAACQAGAQAELDNIDLYDRLLADVNDPVIRDLFTRLQAMSRERHLPAFRRFAGG